MWQRCWLGVVLLLGGTAVPAHGQVTLAWKWKPGDKVYLESTNNTKMNLKFMGTAFGHQGKTTTLDSFKVLKDGASVVLQRTIESMAAQGEGPGAAEGAKLAEQMRGATLTVTLDPGQQKITKMEGAADVIRRANPGGAVGDAAGTINEANLREEMEELLTGYLPPRPVQPGDTWKRRSQLSLGPFGSFNLDGTLTYKGPETVKGKVLQRIDATWVPTFVPPKKAAAAGGLPFQLTKVEFKGEPIKGTYWFDNEAGRLARLTRKFAAKGTMTASVGGQELPLEAENEMDLQVKLVDKPGQ
jgi:hypothetical protein